MPIPTVEKLVLTWRRLELHLLKINLLIDQSICQKVGSVRAQFCMIRPQKVGHKSKRNVHQLRSTRAHTLCHCETTQRMLEGDAKCSLVRVRLASMLPPGE